MTFRKAVWIAGVARSGTSWIGQIFNSHPLVRFRFQPLFSYEFKSRVNEDSTDTDYQSFLTELWQTETDFLTQRDKVETGDYPCFAKSQPEEVLVFKENRFQSVIEPMLRRVPNLHVVAIVRHPCAVMYSCSQNAKEFPAGSDLLKEWRFGGCKNSGPEDYFGYYKWKEVANLYLDLIEQYPNRVTLIHYDQMITDSQQFAQNMLSSAGIEMHQQVREFIEDSGRQNRTSFYSVFKDGSQTHKWKHCLDSYIAKEIAADLRGSRLECFLQEF